VENAVGASAASRFPGSNAAKDFLATLDVTAGSTCFGQVISEADVPTSGNEPHHVGLNVNGTVRQFLGSNVLDLLPLQLTD
jgi:selenium-binding protein 1